jgi:hypothetical protein
VLVVVLAVSGVPAPIVNVVDVIAMRDGHMPAPVAVSMVVSLVHGVLAGGLAFVVVIVVRSMQMSVVHIIDVTVVRNRDMATPFAVDVVVVEMLVVRCSSHRFSPPIRSV